jgi:hypothetical protein
VALMGNPEDLTRGGRPMNTPEEACREVRRRHGTARPYDRTFGVFALMMFAV